MKKIKFIILALTCIVACNEPKKNEEIGLGSTNENGNFIEYYNAFLEVDKEVNKTLKAHSTWIDEDYKELKGGKHYKTLPIAIFGVSSSYKNSKKIIESGLKVKVENQSLINDNAKKYIAALETLFKKRGEFGLYTKAEDYKVDSWKKGDEIVAQMKSACEEIILSKETMFPLMINLADKAEIEFINKDPDKEFIFAMKNSMKLLDTFYDELVFESENKGKSKLDSAYSKLETDFDGLKKLDPAKIKEAARKLNFESYVKQYEETVAICRKITNSVKTKKPNYKWLIGDFNDEYSSQVNSYNYFIN